MLAPRSRWTPASLGPTAWWTADAAFITIASGGVSTWRNRIDGRSGVLVQTDTAADPTWQTTFGVPVVQFAAADGSRLDELSSGQPDGSRATVIDLAAGTSSPFSVLMTVRSTRTAPQVLVEWYSLISANPIVLIEIQANDFVKVSRRSDAGTLTTITGLIEVGTCIRRIGVAYDGARCAIFLDAVVDNNQAMGVIGALTLGKFRVGNDSGLSAGLDASLADLVVLPRAIGQNEWMRYYRWSQARWGAIKAPAFFGSGTGVHGTGAGTITPSYPSSSPAGSLYVLTLLQFVETGAPSAPAGWTFYDVFTVGTSKFYIWFRDARGSGSDSGTINVSVNANSSAVRIHAFTDVSVTATTGGFIDKYNAQSGGGTSCNVPDLSPNGAGRLGALFVLGIGTNAGAASGASGASWVEASEYDAANNLFIQVQTAPFSELPATGGTTSWTTAGGTDSACLGFLFIGV